MSDSETPWTIACQAPLSLEFCKQEYWSGLPCPPPRAWPRNQASPADRCLLHALHCRQILCQCFYFMGECFLSWTCRHFCALSLANWSLKWLSFSSETLQRHQARLLAQWEGSSENQRLWKLRANIYLKMSQLWISVVPYVLISGGNLE